MIPSFMHVNSLFVPIINAHNLSMSYRPYILYQRQFQTSSLECNSLCGVDRCVHPDIGHATPIPNYFPLISCSLSVEAPTTFDLSVVNHMIVVLSLLIFLRLDLSGDLLLLNNLLLGF